MCRGLAREARDISGRGRPSASRARGGSILRLSPGEAAKHSLHDLGGRPVPSGHASGRETPLAPRPARPAGTRYVNAGRDPLPGVMPFARGDLVRVRRGDHVVLDRIKAIRWIGRGWHVDLILVGTVPLGAIERREK